MSATLLGEPLPVELMNTIGFGRDGVRDWLATDAEVAAWFRAVADRFEAAAGIALDSAGHPPDVHDLRDALRLLAAEATDDPREPTWSPDLTRSDAIGTLNTLATAVPQLVWPADEQPTRAYRAAGDPADLAVALIAHQGVELFTGPGRDRLRACLAPNCLLFFYKDQARRQWCSAACGNRVRVARHYRRHHPASRPPERTR